jgi:ribosomal protein L37E
MSAKELRRRLQAADPNLTIVSGRPRYGSKEDQEKQWEKAAGVICKKCGKEVFKSRDGYCLSCWDDVQPMEIIDKCGATNYFAPELLEQIMHFSRNPKAE